MAEAALVVAVSILANLLKKVIRPRFGRTGVQVTVFILALLGALYYTFKENIPGIEMFVAVTIQVFSLSVAFYEVILKKIPGFK